MRLIGGIVVAVVAGTLGGGDVRAQGAAKARAPAVTPTPAPTPSATPTRKIIGTALIAPPRSPEADEAVRKGARESAILHAAGFKYMRGHWESGCNDPNAGASYEPGKVEMLKDLNGDGRLEALVTEGSSYCYGNTGSAFWLLSEKPAGGWQLMFHEVGIAEFLGTKGVGGWPDISVGGPGFCFPVMRWNGKAYVRNRFAYEGKTCRP